MANKFNFTIQKLNNTTLPKKGYQAMYRDLKELGLILRVSYGGNKAFYLHKKINGKTHLIKIGDLSDLSIPDARNMARSLKNDLIAEAHKKTFLKTEELSFRQLLDMYLDKHIKINSVNSDRSIKDITSRVKNAADLFDRKLSTILQEDVIEIFNTIMSRGSTIQANRLLAVLNAIFNKGIKWKLLSFNPAANIEKNKENPRDRYLTHEEKEKFFHALQEEKNQSMTDFFLMLLFTGARSGNVMSMRWDMISFKNKTWSLPYTQTKNHKPLTIHLHKSSLKILLRRKEESISDWVFPSKSSQSGHLQEPRKIWDRICRKADLKDLRLHDLRHTHASWLAIKGVSLAIIGKTLGHQSYQSTIRYLHLNQQAVKDAVNDTFNDIEF